MNSYPVNNQDFKEIIIEKKKNYNNHHKIEITKQQQTLDVDEQPVLKMFGKNNGKLLQNGRTIKNLTQKQLANSINETQKTINIYEQGNLVPDNKILQKLRKVLNIKFDKII